MARGEGIKKVSDLFETYKKRLRAPQKTVIQEFCEVVHDVCGVRLNEKLVSYTPSSRTISLKLPGQIKTEIFLKREEILAHLKGRIGIQSAPYDII